MGGVAWTKEEDHLLKTCIEQYGEGKWHRIPVLAGLNRCRKSCRLRWLNYLRPNIKRGTFAEDEIELIIKLQKLLGNRWSFIAGKLPGRTANDVKNYWKCHLSKKINTEDQSTDQENPPSTKVQVFRPQPQNLVPNSKWPTTLQEAPNVITRSDDPRDANPSIKEERCTKTLASSSSMKLPANEGAGEEGHLVTKGDYDQVSNNDYLELGENDLVGDFSLDFGLEDIKVACYNESRGGCSKWDSDDLILGMDLWSESL